MIYLASPYNSPSPSVMETRFEQACACAGAILSRGHLVYSPICHNHPIAVRYALPRDWSFWAKLDFQMLLAADHLYILDLDGWKESVGVSSEIAFWTTTRKAAGLSPYIDLVNVRGEPVGEIPG